MQVKIGDYITYIGEEPKNRVGEQGVIKSVMETAAGKQYALVNFYRRLPLQVEVSPEYLVLHKGSGK